MNKAQFNDIADKLKIKQERILAIQDVIFNGLTSYKAELCHGLVSGVIQRDVDRVINLYDWSVKVRGMK